MCALVTGVQTSALPIWGEEDPQSKAGDGGRERQTEIGDDLFGSLLVAGKRPERVAERGESIEEAEVIEVVARPVVAQPVAHGEAEKARIDQHYAEGTCHDPGRADALLLGHDDAERAAQSDDHAEALVEASRPPVSVGRRCARLSP